MPDSGYSFGAKFFHRLILGSKFISKASFYFEEEMCKTPLPNKGAHLFISGLARSGTTILMQKLHATGAFCSLTYQDMPFVLMPNIWSKFNHGTKQLLKQEERAHGDGILVGIDSPEAFEEVFWRVFCGSDYIFKEYLSVHKVSDEILQNFKLYINHVLMRNEKPDEPEYLSKNNNNVLRISSLSKYFPYSLFLVPFRDPLQQALSLYNQHKRFSLIHAKDQFNLNYMNWLCHFEFGLNHRPFLFNESESADLLKNYSVDDINYWLLIWRNYYKYMLTIHQENIHFICFEKYCSNPNELLSGLFNLLHLDTKLNKLDPFTPEKRSINNVDMEILQSCSAIYNTILESHPPF